MDTQSASGFILLPSLAGQGGSPMLRTYVQGGSLQRLGVLSFSSSCPLNPVLVVAGTCSCKPSEDAALFQLLVQTTDVGAPLHMHHLPSQESSGPTTHSSMLLPLGSHRYFHTQSYRHLLTPRSLHPLTSSSRLIILLWSLAPQTQGLSNPGCYTPR